MPGKLRCKILKDSVKNRLQSWGLGCHDPPRFLAGGRGVAEGRGRVVKHYYIFSCTGSMFESDNFSSEKV